MLFWKCLTWPESGPRTRSHISEADQRPSSDPLSSHRRLVPRHHCRADGEKGRQREVRAGSTGGPKGHPHPSGAARWDAVRARKPFVVRNNGTLRANVSLQSDLLLLECLPPLWQFYKQGAGQGVILQIRKASSRPLFTHKLRSARANYLIKSIKFDLTSIMHQLLIKPAHFDTHM